MPLTQMFISISGLRAAPKLYGRRQNYTGGAKTNCIRGFMKLEHGIPSYDTIGRVFA